LAELRVAEGALSNSKPVQIRENELRNYTPFSKLESLAEALEALTPEGAQKAAVRPRVFLSHSHRDKDLVTHTARFLKSQGGEVFVDWLSDGMPENVTGETAKRLKEQIKSHHKFVLLVTNNSRNSKWVPWELGIADGERTLTNIASLGVADDDGEYHGNEYLEIYPTIEKFAGKWVVLDEEFCCPLNEWLHKP
jgi:hypothetical protein